LPDEILSEAVVRLLLNQTKAGRLIDAAGGDQHVVRPQRDSCDSRRAGQANAFADKTAPDPEDAGLRLYVKQPQFGNLFAVLDSIAATFIENFDARRERCWIAERDGEVVGSVLRATIASKVSSKPYSSVYSTP